ncbi:hypothetical protein Tco_0626994 [Tanacetum coccineum]|uniref:Uncharacterized protein n=1 Tax=Tanacetum coccineum TaxID=301880 RepID=A0ABQ4WL89_9ASTR
MEIPTTMIDDAFKKLVGYKYYNAKKVESDNEANVPKMFKKDVVPRKTRSLTIAKETIEVELAKSISINEQRTQQRQRSQLTIDRQIDNDVAYTYAEHIKGKCYGTDDADNSDMDLSDDNLDEDDDAAGFRVFMYNKSIEMPKSTYLSLTISSSSLDFIQNLLDETPVNELTDLISNPVYTDTHTTSIVHNPEGNPEQALDAQNAEPSFHKWSHDNQDPPNDHEEEKRKKQRKDVGQSSSRSSTRNKSPMVHAQDDTPAMQPLDQEDEYIWTRLNPEWYTKSGSTGVAKRKTTWFDLLLKSDIDQNKNHILRPSTIAIENKLKAIIQKDKLTIANLEGVGLERLKHQYQNDVELEYHVEQLKATVLSEAK